MRTDKIKDLSHMTFLESTGNPKTAHILHENQNSLAQKHVHSRLLSRWSNPLLHRHRLMVKESHLKSNLRFLSRSQATLRQSSNNSHSNCVIESTKQARSSSPFSSVRSNPLLHHRRMVKKNKSKSTKSRCTSRRSAAFVASIELTIFGCGLTTQFQLWDVHSNTRKRTAQVSYSDPVTWTHQVSSRRSSVVLIKSPGVLSGSQQIPNMTNRNSPEQCLGEMCNIQRIICYVWMFTELASSYIIIGIFKPTATVIWHQIFCRRIKSGRSQQR